MPDCPYNTQAATRLWLWTSGAGDRLTLAVHGVDYRHGKRRDGGDQVLHAIVLQHAGNYALGKVARHGGVASGQIKNAPSCLTTAPRRAVAEGACAASAESTAAHFDAEKSTLGSFVRPHYQQKSDQCVGLAAVKGEQQGLLTG